MVDSRDTEIAAGSPRVLFLLRAYNDIDHITPIIWKALEQGWRVHFVFVDKDFSDDYRVQFLVKQGAKHAKATVIRWYCQYFVPKGSSGLLLRSFNTALLTLFGLLFLIRHRVQIVVTEWTGHFGRNRAVYFLRSAKFLAVPTYAVPHGYFLWRNSHFNQHVEKIVTETGKYPDFSDRNWFTRYVVQSEEHKVENERYGMTPSKIKVLGSARFCAEWMRINEDLIPICGLEKRDPRQFVVLFFLPHWDYQVERERCISLLTKIIELKELLLVIKAHTRGTGALSERERNKLQRAGKVKVAEENEHSPQLIRSADLVINFGSSIGFDALIHGIPVINPRYLHRNKTFFDNSDATFDTVDEYETVETIVAIKNQKLPLKDTATIAKFLRFRINNGGDGSHVLSSYLDLFTSQH